MATKQARAPRTKVNQPKAAPVTEPAPIVTVPQPEPQPEPVIATPAPVQAKKPKAPAKTVVIAIAPARVRSHLVNVVNGPLLGPISELKAQINAYKAAETTVTAKTVEVTNTVDKKTTHTTREATPDELKAAAETLARLQPTIADVTNRCSALAREKIRFANESRVALAVVCEKVVQQLLIHGADATVASGKRTLIVRNIFSEGVENLDLNALVKTLPSYVRAYDANQKALQAAAMSKHDTELIERVRADFQSKYILHLKNSDTPSAPLTTAVVSSEPAPQAEDESDSKTSFKGYVGVVYAELLRKDALNPCVSIKVGETTEMVGKYHGLKLSMETRTFLSDLVIELIRRLAPQFLLTMKSMNNATVTEVTIMRTIEALLTDGHALADNVEFKQGQIRDPEFLKAEGLKRDEAKKAGTKYEAPPVSSIPLVAGLSAERTFSFPTSGFAALNAHVNETLATFRTLSAEAKKALFKEDTQ